jgi:ATP-dependent protease ClpP protease subunit
MKLRSLCGIFMIAMLVMVGCAGMQPVETQPQDTVHTVKIEVITKDGDPVAVQLKDQDDRVMKSMEIKNPKYELSQLAAMYDGKKLYIKLFSGLSVADVTRAWQDMIVAMESYDFGKGENKGEVHLFIDSPGGDAFAGLALADLIEKYQKKGIKFFAHGTGIIASAAVPVFAVCDETHATRATIFMVHEAALWKWPGRESASDIRSQGKLMDLLQKLYLEKLVANSAKHDNDGNKIDFDYWVLLEAKTSWFSVDRALELGILDHVDN